MSDESAYEMEASLAEIDPSHRTQAFFDTYRAEAAKPHAGEHFKQFVANLLLRAEEKELYKP